MMQDVGAAMVKTGHSKPNNDRVYIGIKYTFFWFLQPRLDVFEILAIVRITKSHAGTDPRESSEERCSGPHLQGYQKQVIQKEML